MKLLRTTIRARCGWLRFIKLHHLEALAHSLFGCIGGILVWKLLDQTHRGLDPTQFRVPGLVQLPTLFGILGAAIGALVPTWYRQESQANPDWIPTEKVAEWARNYEVRKLSLFGCAATEDYEPTEGAAQLLLEFFPENQERVISSLTMEAAIEALSRLLPNVKLELYNLSTLSKEHRTSIARSLNVVYEAPQTSYDYSFGHPPSVEITKQFVVSNIALPLP